MGTPTYVAGEVWTAAYANSIGMHLVKTQTIGTAVSSVSVTSAFSADYDQYLVTVIGGVGSATTANLGLTFPNAGSVYYYGIIYNTFGTATVSVLTANTATSFPYAGGITTNSIDAHITIRNPYNAKTTAVSCQYIQHGGSANQGTMNGFLSDTTSYTSFTITPSSGTLTGGTIRVYGYRNSLT